MALDLPKLADGFAAPDGARWRALAEKALKGKPIESLTQATYDGVGVRALYTAADAPGGTSVGRARAGAWDIRAVVAAEAAGQALEELEGGATSIELQAYADFTDFAGALSGVLLDLAPLALDAGAALGPAQALADFARRRGLRAAPFAFNLDPFAALARDGAAPAPANVLSLAAKLHAEFPNALVLRADARAVHESGGSEAQELAWMLAAGAGLLRAGEAAGLAPETVSATTLFTLAVGDDATLEIAKLRAARKLWAHALAACGASAPMTLHAVTGARMMTRRDAWTNMLRTTAAGFAAGVGGADVVSILPMTHALGAPTPFARRIARNTQILLLEESHLARVADPAAGSWAFESLTEELAQAAWALFQEIEKRGGIATAFAWFSGEIARVRDARMRNVRWRKDAITGVSEFPLIAAREVEALPRPAPGPRAGLPEIRLAQPFENLRDAAQRAGTPAIFLATLGPLAQFSARAMFAKNLFEAGGLGALGAEHEHESEAALIAAYRKSGAKIACLCGADVVYAERAEGAARALKAAGCAFVFLAGRPGDAEARLRMAGVDAFAFAGGDAIETLQAAHAALGIA